MAERAGDPDSDALAYFADEFERQGMSNNVSGPDTLRHLFVLLIGLGMRESSGVCWEGRDQSADNVQSDTCEAGLFQSSWNYRACATDAETLFDEYRHALEAPEPQCQLKAFEDSV